MQPRQRILESAFILFHKQGYNSTGINQIIAESNVAKASFYQHFKSKEDLCVEFLNKRHTYWFEQLKIFTSKDGTSKTKILASFDFLIYMNEIENFRGCSFLNILSEIPADNTKILNVIQSHKNDLRQYFKTLVVDSQLADHIYLLFESAIIESQLFKDQWAITKSKTIINALIN
ncbi:TetR/AcrR family transcriptional regulator [Pedobacter punctiformis]|uniref:TetR/AcrR family transcriptional regulator n=1 Tax=Pedobacter punctiformis TaxID=3004097 RepID=A0ABT4L8Q1_9SPHI|nr:TetR/AcrR family transcriptional regulator [Pedobacter sp. HCMS5-2]MCZ4244296.1 TetR/AcrR family transcriptional regulator [Pedobacter sp. HCMS5-2]